MVRGTQLRVVYRAPGVLDSDSYRYMEMDSPRWTIGPLLSVDKIFHSAQTVWDLYIMSILNLSVVKKGDDLVKQLETSLT